MYVCMYVCMHMYVCILYTHLVSAVLGGSQGARASGLEAAPLPGGRRSLNPALSIPIESGPFGCVLQNGGPLTKV